MNIRLDSSVRHLSKIAAYHLSGTLQNGVMFTGSKESVIYSDRVEFGRCDPYHERMVQEIKRNYVGFPGVPGNIASYYFYEKGFFSGSGRVIYRFGHFFKYDEWTKSLDYDGGFANPEEPDNKEIFAQLYPRFA